MRQQARTQRRQAGRTAAPAEAFAGAERLFAAGDFVKAEEAYRQVLKRLPEFHAAWFRLGLIAARADKLPLAAELMAKAVGLDPSVAVYSRALCEVCRRLKRYERALGCGRAAVTQAPRDPEARFNLALALSDAGRPRQAAEQYRAVLDLVPAHAAAAAGLGKVLEALGDSSGAEAAYAQAVAADPRNAEALNNLGALQGARGLLDEARAGFAAALALKPRLVFAHHNLAALKTYAAGDPQLKILEDMAQEADRLDVPQRIRFWFALGKARDDTRDFDAAFDAYRRGNTLLRAGLAYNEAGPRAVALDLKQRFTQGFFEKRGDAGCPDETPVFIVGMPRSGSALLEQVLSSHPDVHGAGDGPDFNKIVNEVLGVKRGRPPMERLLAAPAADLRRIGETYATRLREGGVKALRVTDTTSGNFFHLGLIRLCLPGARIVHAMRNPMDACFSCYSRLFNAPMPFAYDLRELGHYYSLHRQLMEHWKKTLPAESVLELRYEDLVADLEKEARRLVAHCGLPWDDACLKFYENPRPVRASSLAQLRRPIYGGSVMRWENFKSRLGPLRAAIDDQAWKI